MIVSIEWLKEFVDINETPEELAELLSKTGLEAEIVGIPNQLSGIIVGKVETAEKHPDADKLKLCTVNDGNDIQQVVCGAPNVDKGQTIAFATVGSVLPGNFKIKKAKIRGVESHGMICSERELHLSDEHEGILVLPDNLKAGDDFIDAYGYKFLSLELDITPNRPDAFSHQGVARDIACKMNRVFRPLVVDKIDTNNNQSLKISMESSDDCPRYIGGIVKNVTVGPSPEWMVEKLKASGQRSINNVVDISNYVLMEIGYPTHIFDFNTLAENKIFVRRAKNGETITTIDENKQKLNDSNLLITDGKTPVALAGIMGGLKSAVTDKTTEVLVESAYFDPIVTRRSAKHLQMSTDASKRYERGVDPNGAKKAFHRVVSLLIKYAGGELDSDIVDVYDKKITPNEIVLTQSKMNLIMGFEVDDKEIDRILDSLGFEHSKLNNEWKCFSPTFRPDIEREIDIIEEIARMVGYDNIPSDNNIYGQFRYDNPDPESHLKQIRQTLTGFGFYQIYANSLQNEDEATLSGKTPVKMMNPLSNEMAYLRTSLIPGLLKNVDFNIKHGAADFRLFELANVHDKTGDSLDGINEYKHLAGIIYGKEVKDSVHNSAVNEGLFSLKGYLIGIFEDRYGMRIDLKKDDYPGFDYGQTVLINRQNVGVMGRLSNHWSELLDLDIEDAYAFEINLEPISKMMSAKKRFKPISAYPKISRDINLVMKESQSVGPIIDMIIRLGNNLIIHTSPMNIFIDDKTLGKGMKSVTLTMTFQHSSKTLEDKDVNPVIKEIIRVADKDFNAKLRS